jgi:hypothetical protein
MSTVNVNIVDKSVASLNPINIAIINQPNPVNNYPVNGEQMLQLIQFPQYWITDAATGNVINGGNIYDYFPELKPGGGGGGGGGSDLSYTIASYVDGTSGETTYRLMESRDGGTPVAVGDVIEFRGNMMLVTYGTQQMLLNTALSTINDAIEDKQDKAPDGTHNLIDADGVVDPRYLPDYLLGACIYAGNVGTDAVATLTTAAQHKLGTTAQSITLTNDTTDITGYIANEGLYYIATAEFSFASLAIKAGDWLISTGTMWGKVDNTDAVTGVKGDAESTYRIGNVNITKGNIGLENVDNTTDLDKPISTATQEALDLKLDSDDVDDALSEESENPVQNKVITNTIGDVDEVLRNVLSRGFVPTEEQLEAINSGITAADVAQIETNKNNISLKANASDVNTALDMLLVKNKVMFTDVGLTQGYYISGDNGTMISGSAFYASDYVDVSNMDSIILYNTQMSAYYNASKEYMGNFGNVTTTLMEETSFQIPEGAKYIRCSVYNTRVNTAYYKPHSNSSPLVDGYSYAFKMSDIDNDAGYLKNDALYIGANRKYTTLRSGIAEAIKTPNTKVYVDAGEYDLITEFATEIQAAGTTQYGIRLENGVHIIFSSGAKVIANYTGGNTNVEKYFSPFYSGNHQGVTSDFILENLDVESKNTRYCVHDECSGGSEAYTHKYINCKMSNDNVDSAIGKDYYPQCIGGGLGKYGYIDIEGCYFKTKRAETERTTCVSYHNNFYANSKSNINVRNCYFDDYGTFRVGHYGTSTDISQAIICNCSLGLAPYIQYDGSSSGPENMSLLAYMNEIRNDIYFTVNNIRTYVASSAPTGDIPDGSMGFGW